MIPTVLAFLMIAQPDLPTGNNPTPVAIPHFPDRLHAFVWRNWQLVPAERMASVVGAKPDQIRALGRAMGLGGPPRIAADQQRRSYITVIRRNWHLLPYYQLLQLLGWTEEKLAYTLREDDFLYVKLGNHKPKCEPIHWRESDESAKRREKEIAAIVRAEFPEGIGIPKEPLFTFVKDLSSQPISAGMAARKPDRLTATPLNVPVSSLNPRFCYSYFALYGDPLLEKDADPYPDGYLARLAESGVNGVWLQGVLYKLAPFPWDPKLSVHYQERLANLRTLCARAKRRGIGIFLYMNEPRAMPLSFFDSHPELKGAVEGDHAALCTSAPAVQEYIRNSIASICRAVPDLGGFFTITASENLSNCWSHGRGGDCPRCGKRKPEEVIAEVNGMIREGVERAGSRAELICWDWGWADSWIAGIIERLPVQAAVMSVSEWGIPIKRGGVESTIGEYSLSTIGPGPRAARTWELARKRGLKTIAKIQAANSWELSAVPYIPAVANSAQHAANLRAAGVNGIMLGWTLGGYPSPNLEVVNAETSGGAEGDTLTRVALRRFGEYATPKVVSAWRGYAAAFREFPFHVGTVYSAPLQMGPANPLYESPTRYAASMVGIPYDDLNAWRAVYPADKFAEQLDKVGSGFLKTRGDLIAALGEWGAKVTPAQRKQLEGELRIGEACGLHFISVANQCRFVMWRDQLARAKTAEEAKPILTELEGTLHSEITLAKSLYRLQNEDSRFGFEATNQYYYVPVDLAEKVLNCRDLLDRWLPAQKTRWRVQSQ